PSPSAARNVSQTLRGDGITALPTPAEASPHSPKISSAESRCGPDRTAKRWAAEPPVVGGATSASSSEAGSGVGSSVGDPVTRWLIPTLPHRRRLGPAPAPTAAPARRAPGSGPPDRTTR